MSGSSFTGGCQCGALRYSVQSFGRASICHCRMCQKAFGNYFAPLVEVRGFKWERGEPTLYASSNISNRGFCSRCGTPMILDTDGAIELAIATLDKPDAIVPEYHCNLADRILDVKGYGNIPDASSTRKAENDRWNERVISYQHPDHPTDSSDEMKQ